jgi:ADP-ribose pyrophosphatase YjhB (NUDIX family)
MRLRNCAGGVVFHGDKVLLIRNDKGDWVLPKGVVRDGNQANVVAIERVKHEAGVDAMILAPAGETCYEFFSVTRRLPICNRIDWFIMKADNEDCRINEEEGFQDGGFFTLEKAAEMITYSQDRALVYLSHEKFVSFE